ncbi:PKD domain-containing protein, partial [Kibdelosporangium lantanae]
MASTHRMPSAIPNTGGWGNVISPTVVLTNPGRTVKLYAVFTNPAWTPTSPDLMSYDWFQFNGTGVSKPGTTVVATATPTTPGTFAFSGTTSGPVTAYSWDFGDNTPAVSGVTANHTYARKGTYTARLTTTDSEGVHNSGIVQLVVSHAFHSPLMEPMLAEFRATLSQLTYRSPRIPFVSTVYGRLVEDELRNPDYWLAHVHRPVRFGDALTTLRDLGVGVFLEAGPGTTLSGLGREAVP